MKKWMRALEEARRSEVIIKRQLPKLGQSEREIAEQNDPLEQELREARLREYHGERESGE